MRIHLRRALGAIVIGLGLASVARAASDTRDPLDLPMRSYGLILAAALLGGIVRWSAAVRRGEQSMDMRALVGELAASALAGLLVFWGGTAVNLSPLIVAAACGIAGHAGPKALMALEVAAERVLRRWFPDVPKP